MGQSAVMLLCFAKARRSSPISSWASLSLSLVLCMVFTAVDMDRPVDGGPSIACSPSLMSWSELNSNCIPVRSLAWLVAALAWASSLIASSLSLFCWHTFPKDAIDLLLVSLVCSIGTSGGSIVTWCQVHWWLGSLCFFLLSSLFAPIIRLVDPRDLL